MSAIVWLIIPTYNEAVNLERIVTAARAELSRVAAGSYRILVVDDNSPDGTGAIAASLAAASDDVEVLHRPGKAGLGQAYLAGFDHALRSGAEMVIEMDADFSHDPRYLPAMLEAARSADLVLGSRYVPGGGVREPVALDELARSVAAERVVLGTIDAVQVSGDRAALARAVGNLVENGLVHGPADGVVTVSVAREGEHARVTVRDAGPGPDPADHDQLFQRFWRGDGTSERPGAGLGLSIVAAIAAQHAGQVLVDGSAFTLELPVAN